MYWKSFYQFFRLHLFFNTQQKISSTVCFDLSKHSRIFFWFLLLKKTRWMFRNHFWLHLMCSTIYYLFWITLNGSKDWSLAFVVIPLRKLGFYLIQHRRHDIEIIPKAHSPQLIPLSTQFTLENKNILTSKNWISFKISLTFVATI